MKSALYTFIIILIWLVEALITAFTFDKIHPDWSYRFMQWYWKPNDVGYQKPETD